ncbi:uncharacterized protein PHACADRAFT_82948, partial [Phanerochaete carnosa HHB-10118-sp]
DLERAKELFQNYLDGFFKMHPKHIKPNIYYSTHIFDQIPDYGPMYGFWTYLFERLNNILKGYSVNGHGGGELEVTFFRKFSRQVKLRSMLNNLSAISLEGVSQEDVVIRDTACILTKGDGEARGTVTDLARDAAVKSEESKLSHIHMICKPTSYFVQ